MNYLSFIYLLNFVFLLICSGFLNDNKISTPIFESPKSNYLAEVLFSLPHETLLGFAKATEEYHYKAENSINVHEGNTYNLASLSDNELVKAIIQETEDHPEIASIHKLRVLINGDLKEKAKINRERILRSQFMSYSLEIIRDCSIKIEEVENRTGNANVQVDLNNRNNMIEYILENIYKQPKLASGYNSICNIFDFSLQNVIYMDESKLREIMPILSKEVLKVYCLVFERYDMEHNPKRKSVMQKYLNKLKKRQLMGFLNIFIEKYPEINSIRKIEEKRKEYYIPLKIN